MAAFTIRSDFGAQENKIYHCFPICHEVIGLDAMILFFWMLSFNPAFSLSSCTFIKGFYSSSLLSTIRVVSSAYLRFWYFSQQSWFQLVIHPAWHFAWCTLHRSKISRVTIYSLVVLLFQFWTSLLASDLMIWFYRVLWGTRKYIYKHRLMYTCVHTHVWVVLFFVCF